jgi:hypothetical protein
MGGLLHACLQIPTVLFTVGLGITLVYWSLVLLGALDVDHSIGDASGAAKGIGEAVSAGKALGDGHGDPGGHVGHGDHAGAWDSLGLGGVPITISGSVLVVTGWALSILGMHYGKALLGEATWWLALLVLVGVVLVGTPLAGLLVRPLRSVFKLRVGKGNRDYVGSICTITTGQVDRDNGQATVEDGGTVLVIPVRCDKPGALSRGARAIVIDFDPDRHVYLVAPTDDLGLPVEP